LATAVALAAAFRLLDEWHPSSLRLAHEEFNRLYHRVVLTAVALFALVWVFRSALLESSRLYQDAEIAFATIFATLETKPSPGGAEVVINALWVALAAYVLPVVLNLPFRYSRMLSEAALLRLRDGAELERLQLEATRPGNELPLLFTMASGKVYVGLVLTLPRPSPRREWVRMLPLLSGHRDEAQRFVPDTIYLSAYAEVLAQPANKRRLGIRDWELLLRLNDVKVVSRFDVGAFTRHFMKQPDARTPNAVDNERIIEALDSEAKGDPLMTRSRAAFNAYIGGMWVCAFAVVVWRFYSGPLATGVAIIGAFLMLLPAAADDRRRRR
jgi:hypothetical protein